MTKQSVERMCLVADDVYRSALRRIAERVRTEVIVPYCIRYRLYFRQGNGYYFFYRCGDDTVVKNPAQAIVEVLSAAACPEGDRIYEFMDNFG